VKAGTVLCARSIKPFERSRPRGGRNIPRERRRCAVGRGVLWDFPDRADSRRWRVGRLVCASATSRFNESMTYGIDTMELQL
jgi:hypothetical protein